MTCNFQSNFGRSADVNAADNILLTKRFRNAGFSQVDVGGRVLSASKGLNALFLFVPNLTAELVTIHDDIVRYRVYCDQYDDWHYHGPQDGHRECHCIHLDSLYHRTGYFIELTNEQVGHD